MKQKSAKDIAFDKERAKFRSEIRELTNCLNVRQNEIDHLNEILTEKDQLIIQQQERIEKLLEYTKMTKEDLQNLIDSEKSKSELREKIISSFEFFEMMNKKSHF